MVIRRSINASTDGAAFRCLEELARAGDVVAVLAREDEDVLAEASARLTDDAIVVVLFLFCLVVHHPLEGVHLVRVETRVGPGRETVGGRGGGLLLSARLLDGGGRAEPEAVVG